MPLKRFASSITFAAVLLIALVVIDHTRPFAYLHLRNLYRDALARAGRKAVPDPRLVFMAIDSDSVGLDEETDAEQMWGLRDKNSIEARALHLMTRRFPWPREIYALMIERLISAGATVVAFDLTFPTSTDGDAPFHDALERYRERVVIGSNFVDPSWSGLSKVGASHTRPPESLVPQTSPMDDRVAYTNFWPDPDDVVRRAQYRVTFEQVQGTPPNDSSERFLSLASRSLIKAGLGHRVPDGLNNYAMRFAGSPRLGFPPHSIFEIFVPDYWQHNYQDGEFFRGKIVLIGAEGNWQHDEHQTPLGTMPGPEMHLNAMNSALRGEFIREIGDRGTLGLIIAGAVLALLLSHHVRSPWLRLGALAVCDAGSIGLAIFAFNYAGIFLPLVAPWTQLNLTILGGLIADFAFERVEKTRLRRTFERYVSRDVVRQMIEQPKLYAQSLGGVMKPAAIMFTDIRGYSKVTAESDPHVLVVQLNEYLTAMVDCVFRFGGTLDKFIGDAVMAVWGNVTSSGPAQDARGAVQAALAMRRELARLNANWRERGLPEFRVGIAVHHGDVIVGNMGSPQRMEFTVIGDAVNVTWKLQELTKDFGCDIIVSETVANLVVEHFEMRSLGPVNLRGQAQLFKIFSLEHSLAAPDVAVHETLSPS
jgi:adenylate cyclase